MQDCGRSAYQLINPLLRCGGKADLLFVGEYEDFEIELAAWLDRQKEAGVIDEAAVYFRDLRAGPWFGIDERTEFVPSSLFKLPLMIAVLRASENVDDLLLEEVTLSGVYTGLQNVTSAEETVIPGQYYTVETLLRKMIAHSDNASQFVLKQVLVAIDPTGDAVKAIYSDLGMVSAYEKETLTVKSYASLFRVLYNARYLPPELSEKALEILSEATFYDGLRKGIPPDIIVAHKFGIRDVPDEPDQKQLHDCGIVYHPVRPYLVCIMTRGKDRQRNADIIGEVSERIYKNVSEHTSGTE